MSNYPNLPGFEITVNDGGLIIPDVGTTESLLIIAPCRKVTGSPAALDAPQEPTLIRNSAQLKATFGDFVVGSNVNEIAAAWKAAFDGGCRRIYLLALHAPNAGTPLTLTEQFEALHGLFYGILQDFEVDHVVVVGNYADEQCPLVNGDLGTTAASQLAELPGVITIPDSDAEGPLTETYEGNFAKLLGDYCENQTINNSPVIGYIGTKPISGTVTMAAVASYVNNLITPTDDEQAPNFYSPHVSVVSGPALGYTIPGKADAQFMNGVVTYAALVSTLRPESAPTNKPVAGVTGVQYNLSLSQLDRLSGARYVSFRLKRGAVYVTDGITTAPRLTIGGETFDSDYTRLSTLRITLAAIDLIREIADPFIGEPAGIPQRNALTASIKTGLESMRTKGAVTNYAFSVIQDGTVIGQTTVTLQLVPAFENKKILVDVSLRTQL